MYKLVTTYITTKMIARYHIPSVIGTPAFWDARPMVSGLVIAVVKPTPDVIKIKLMAVNLDQFIAAQSIAKSG